MHLFWGWPFNPTLTLLRALWRVSHKVFHIHIKLLFSPLHSLSENRDGVFASVYKTALCRVKTSIMHGPKRNERVSQWRIVDNTVRPTYATLLYGSPNAFTRLSLIRAIWQKRCQHHSCPKSRYDCSAVLSALLAITLIAVVIIRLHRHSY